MITTLGCQKKQKDGFINMTIKIQTHGGRCCGIKSIHGFHGNTPDDIVVSKKAQPENWQTDMYGHSVGRNYNWYRPKRPRETYLQGFEEYIRYIQEHRPAGLIEVTMTRDQLDFYGWRPHLGRLGFKETLKFKNSNSNDTVYVFHLVYDFTDDDEYDDDDYYDDDYEGED